MSHVNETKVAIRIIPSLREALKEFPGAELLPNTACRWYGRSVGDTPLPKGYTTAAQLEQALACCPYVIRIPEAGYDIAVLKNVNGDGYSLFYDSWGRGKALLKVFGNGLGKLTQSYTKHATKVWLRNKGFTYQTAVNKDGTLRLTVAGK